jgi:hypothetical protein
MIPPYLSYAVFVLKKISTGTVKFVLRGLLQWFYVVVNGGSFGLDKLKREQVNYSNWIIDQLPEDLLLSLIYEYECRSTVKNINNAIF